MIVECPKSDLPLSLALATVGKDWEFLPSTHIFHPTFAAPLPATPFNIFVDHKGNYGAITEINGLAVTMITSSAIHRYLTYLASFVTKGTRNQQVSVKVLSTQSTQVDEEKLPLLVVLLRAHKHGSKLGTAQFTIPDTITSTALIECASHPTKTAAKWPTIPQAKFTLYCFCCRPFMLKLSEQSTQALAVSAMTECSICQWKYNDCELAPLSQSGRQKWKCTNCATFWSIHDWGGSKVVDDTTYEIRNTCSLDSILAAILSHYRKYPAIYK